MLIYLASKSPRRLNILSRAGYQVELLESSFEEILPASHPDAEKLSQELALAKMNALEALPSGGGWVVTADTLVYLGEKIMGKPEDRNAAHDMLRTLSGKTHCVTTAFCLMGLEERTLHTRSSVTRVTFDEISRQMLDRYLDSGEWTDKAGAYGIQGAAASFISGIDGCFYNVVGFPLNLFYRTLQQLEREMYLT